jgi:hypothetical protein
MKPTLHALVLVAGGAFSSFSMSATNADHCSGKEGWATSMAFVHLKNAHQTDNDKLDFKKTKTVRLASEKIGKDLFRQVHHVTFTEISGRKIEVITVNGASSTECSMSGVQVFVVSQQLGER